MRSEPLGLEKGVSTWHSLTILYISFAVTHSMLMVAGLMAVVLFRAELSVSIRGWKSMMGAALCLQTAIVAILLAYPLDGSYSCSTEYCIMGIVLPCGMALSQACDMRSVQEARKQCEVEESFVSDPIPDGVQMSSSAKKTMRQWVCSGAVLLVELALAMQVVLILFLHFGSRRFHSDSGIFGKPSTAAECRTGPEWIPLNIWLSFWTLGFGPWVLISVRRIADNRSLIWQGTLSFFTLAPGIGLWLIFSYTDSKVVRRVNFWFVPTGWLLPGLMTKQIVSVLFPLLEAFWRKRLTQRDGSQTSRREGDRTHDLYSMHALELQILKNPQPLLQWARETDLTAENIMFLREVASFKKKWIRAQRRAKLNDSQLRERFEDAAMIWFKLVNPITAQFNINIDHRTLSELHSYFEGLKFDGEAEQKSVRTGETNVIAPWEMLDDDMAEASSRWTCDVDRLYMLPNTAIVTEAEVGEVDGSESTVFCIPCTFDVDIFDEAYETVKMDVYLNTWPRFRRQRSLNSHGDV